MTFYAKVQKNFSKFLRWLYRIEIVNEDNVPKNGNAIICANHTSNADVVILGVSASRQIKYMAKAELFKIPILKQLITALGAFPVNRGKTDMSSIKKTIEILNNGEMVGMFPQGTRRKGIDPRTTEIKNGVGMIAYRSHAPVVPVFIETKNNHTGMFKKTRVIFGKPLTFNELNFDKGTFREFESASRKIFDEICSLHYNKTEDKRSEN